MMTNSELKIAVAQIDRPGLAALFDKLIVKDVDWYLFDENSDLVFELNELKAHYDKVYMCEFKEIIM